VPLRRCRALLTDIPEHPMSSAEYSTVRGMQRAKCLASAHLAGITGRTSPGGGVRHARAVAGA
jgi:hypothetical protein